MLERLPYFRCHPADYLLDTMNLSIREHGAYWLLMLNYYWNGSIPSDKESLYSLCKAVTPEDRASVDSVLKIFFHSEDGKIVHHRVERELEKLVEFFHRKREAGKLGAGKRWNKSGRKNKEKINGVENLSVEMPDWLDAATFKSWIAIRPAKARTPASQQAAIEKLEKFKSQGHDPNAIVKESLSNGWQGIFAPEKEKKKGGYDPFNPGPGKAVM